MMTNISLADQSNAHDRTAAYYRRISRKDAFRAEGFYGSARTERRAALLLPEWGAARERAALAFTKCGDMYLQSSFHATELARSYNRMAAEYRKMMT